MLGQIRRFATQVAKEVYNPHFPGELMSAWQVEKFGGLEQLILTQSAKVPELTRASSIKIKVLASSVNPLDSYMLGGYGNVLLDCLKQVNLLYENRDDFPWPMILGRDFCGEVVAKGTEVRDGIRIGDIVYGAVPPHCQGSHADALVIDNELVSHKPKNVTVLEAASLPYTAMTAWSALKISGDMCLCDPKSKRVLVIGASGGVGTAAVQLLKAWGSTVIATCSEDAVPLVKSLNADLVIDYKQKESLREIELAGKYDIILDASGNITFSTYTPFLKDWSNSKLITLKSPLLRNTDDLGIVGGMLKNAVTLLDNNISTGALKKGSTVRWGFYAPIGASIREINKYVESGQIKPVIDSTYKFNDLPSAFKRVTEGHLRGKVVVSHL